MKELTNSEQVEITGGGFWGTSFFQGVVEGARTASTWIASGGGFVAAALVEVAAEAAE